MARIFAYIPHQGGVADDMATELFAAAAKIDPAASPTAVLTGCGASLDAACNSLQGAFAEIWKVSDPALAYPDAELVRKALLAVLPPGCMVLVPHSHFGVDLAPGLAIKLGGAYVPDVLDVETAGALSITAVRQEFGGQVNAHVRCDTSQGAVLTIRPGAFAQVQRPEAGWQVVEHSVRATALVAKRRHLETAAVGGGDIDITKFKTLVSVGRGIEEKDNIPIAEELAEAVGGAVSCSRPVVDARWLDKSRQVGSSGKTVKPKVYLACGIIGSFQHLAGLKGNPFIVAINKNPKAPIFRVADIGIVDDILEFLPALTDKVREERGVPSK